MFSQGNILYFDNYIFSNGSSKPKYFLVIKDNVEDNNILLLSLPSSKVHVPEEFAGNHGCLNIRQKGLGCYIFNNSVPVTECGFKFPLMTYIYAEFVTTASIASVQNAYKPDEYRLIGKLLKKEHDDIIECMKKSPKLINKFKKHL
jgi:hypothetical protein